MGLNDDLDVLERMMRQLQIEWEKFFGGAEKKPPTDLKAKVEGLIRRYAYSEIRNNTERFRYQSLASRYSTFNELWSKRLRALEEGRPVGLHGPRATAPPPSLAAAGSGNEFPPSRGEAEFRIRGPEDDREAVRALFEKYQEARRQNGEGAVKFASFEKIIAQQATRILAEKGGHAVDFRLETKGGKVTLKAKPVK